MNNAKLGSDRLHPYIKPLKTDIWDSILLRRSLTKLSKLSQLIIHQINLVKNHKKEINQVI